MCAGEWALFQTPIASAARERGAEIKVNAPVSRIQVQDGRVTGVALIDGNGVQRRSNRFRG